MKRIYEILLKRHLAKHRQMIFLSGPRQVGKTTTSIKASSEFPIYYYFNWDNESDRRLFLQGPAAMAEKIGISQSRAIVFDELHKYKYWKEYLKGIYDGYQEEYRFLITGSGRLDLFQKQELRLCIMQVKR